METNAICTLAMMPMRAEPGHRSEMVSQLLFGEVFSVLESNDSHWHRICCRHDNYEGWIFSRHFQYVSNDFLTRYDNEKVMNHCEEAAVTAASDKETYLVPFGARLPNYKEGTFYLGDTTVRFSGMKMNTERGTVEEVMRTVRLYLNAPYLWGGRSLMGIDCSGFTQMVYKMNGYKLPRDAYQQAEVGKTIPTLNGAQAGDLAFFAESERITHVGILTGKGTIIHASEYVREDQIDENGIFNRDLQAYTLKVLLIKRYL
jgi:hypothetical protein